MKKILTKLALTLIASILCINLAYANASDTAYTEAKKILDAMDTCEEFMEEYPIVIKLYETLELQGDEPDGEFRILDCYQHTIVNDPANKDIVKFTLSKTTWWDDCDDVTYKNQKGFLHSCRQIQVIFSKSGTLVMYIYINTLYRWATGIVGLISVAVIIFSGIQIATSGGDNDALTKAKKRIVQSLSGIALLFLLGLILYTVNPTFFTLS